MLEVSSGYVPGLRALPSYISCVVPLFGELSFPRRCDRKTRCDPDDQDSAPHNLAAITSYSVQKSKKPQIFREFGALTQLDYHQSRHPSAKPS